MATGPKSRWEKGEGLQGGKFTSAEHEDIRMISGYVNKRLETISKLSQDGKRVKDLYSLLLKKDLWLRAYGNIAPNKGATTPGPDGITQDGFSEGRVENLIQLLREGRYHSKPVRRTYIPKSNGKMRPLGIPMPSAYCISLQRRLGIAVVALNSINSLYQPTQYSGRTVADQVDSYQTSSSTLK